MQDKYVGFLLYIVFALVAFGLMASEVTTTLCIENS